MIMGMLEQTGLKTEGEIFNGVKTLPEYKEMDFFKCNAEQLKNFDDVPEFLEANNYKRISTRRKNTVKQFISYQIALEKREWINVKTTETICLNVKTLLADLNKMKNEYKKCDELFKNLNTLEIFYEDMSKDYQQQMNRIFSFLNLEQQQVKPTTIKQESRPLKDIIENYVDVKRILEDTDFVRCL